MVRLARVAMVAVAAAALLMQAAVSTALAQEVQPVGGVVRAGRTAVLSFSTDGLVTMLAREGAVARKGEALGRLDQRRALSKLRAAMVNLQAAEAQLDETVHDRDVQKDLLAADIITEEAFRNLEFKVRYSEIKVLSAREAVSAAQLDVDDCTLAAPFSGVVTRVEAAEAQWTGRGKPVMEFADATNLELSTDVPLERTRGLGPGVKTVLLDGDEVVGEAVVRAMVPMLDAASGLRRVVWDVTPRTDVLAGRYVTLKPW